MGSGHPNLILIAFMPCVEGAATPYLTWEGGNIAPCLILFPMGGVLFFENLLSHQTPVFLLNLCGLKPYSLWEIF